MPKKFYYKCTNCGRTYPEDELIYLCPHCSKSNQPGLPPKGVLKIFYDYEKIVSSFGEKNLFNELNNKKFSDILPVKTTSSLSPLRIGGTPLYKISALDGKNLLFDLHFKDDSQNPTFSFKDRASSLVSAMAKENNISTIIAASTGNAGSSLAGICASQKQSAVIIVPASAPVAKLSQILMYGAQIVPVNGNYDQAFDLSVQLTKKYGFYNRNTAFNPLTIEGKKTVSFEIFEQLNQKIPDRIFVPVGDGVIISGVYKGFEDLSHLGIIKKIPEIIGVQAEGSSNFARNDPASKFVIYPGHTIADSISVETPRNFFMAKDFIRKYNGKTIIVSDKEIKDASSILSRNTGIFSEPAAVAAFAGFLQMLNSGKILHDTTNVILLTGSGLKDLEAVKEMCSVPKPVEPKMENIEKFLKL